MANRPDQAGQAHQPDQHGGVAELDGLREAARARVALNEFLPNGEATGPDAAHSQPQPQGGLSDARPGEDAQAERGEQKAAGSVELAHALAAQGRVPHPEERVDDHERDHRLDGTWQGRVLHPGAAIDDEVGDRRDEQRHRADGVAIRHGEC
ncbi:hypothetical protein BA899_09645 [Spiribacter sp. SSL99]|nr:hypothetical protein BA899_09645 [Spiribacter sp. SSL99]